MKRSAKQPGATMIVLVAAALIMLSGCLQSETVIRIRPDGSGEVVERFSMAGEIVGMLAGFASMGGQQEFSLIQPDELRARAGQMGPGVRFLGAEATSSEWGEGYIARYSFEDINTLRVNQNPSDNVPLSGDELPGEPVSKEFLTFSFRRGNPSALEVLLPAPDDESFDEESVVQAQDPEELAAAMRFYEDMRIAVRIEVIGTLVSTDADHRRGNSVTLMDIDFNRIIRNQELSRAILGQGAGSLAQVQRLALGTEGVQIEAKDRITLTLR
jgi:hypothetical protein